MAKRAGEWVARAALACVTLVIAVCLALPVGIVDMAGLSAHANAAETTEETKESATEPAQPLDLRESTAVVTADSGYHLTLRVTNTGDETLPAGQVRVLVNPRYTFRSRYDVQQWAQGDMRIATNGEIGVADVAELAPGAQVDVTVDAPTDTPALTNASWGAKPVLVQYLAGQDGRGAAAKHELHTFLTVSPDENEMQGDSLALTVALPVSGAGQWTVDEETLQALLTKGTDGQVVTLGETRSNRTVSQLASRHAKLQVVADPTYLAALDMAPQAAAISQPGMFDVTGQAALDDADARAATGVGGAAWTADAALADWREAIGDQKADTLTIATQGSAQWTLQALTEAKRQGYDTVLATQDFEPTQTATVHNAKTVVPTEAGDVTVLVEQNELGQLAKGQATSRKALAERGAAGRVARFMAQSAFYQTEAPYTARNLLVYLASMSGDETLDADQAERLLSAVESASWLQLTGLDELIDSEPYASGSEALADVPENGGLTAGKRADITQTMSSLASSRAAMLRVDSAVLVDGGDGANDAQALARQDAAEVTNRQLTAAQWVARLLEIHDQLALHALTGGGKGDGGQAAQHIADALLAGVSITPAEAMTVVTETAQMPVTVSNRLPYAVSVRVSSITNSMEIVTSRNASITVPANGEAQVTFDVRVSTSSKATASLTLHDREGTAFGPTVTRGITSVLRISDKTGFLIIALAVVLFVLGLWRQFHRTKDADE